MIIKKTRNNMDINKASKLYPKEQKAFYSGEGVN